MQSNIQETELIDFGVLIPTMDGTGIAETVTIQVPVTTDSETGEKILTPAALEQIAQTQTRHMGLMLPDEIRRLRMRLNLTQAQIGDLLQAGEKSYTRWETGRSRPSRSTNVVLCALRDGKITIPYLKRLQEPFSKWCTSSLQEPIRVNFTPETEKPEIVVRAA